MAYCIHDEKENLSSIEQVLKNKEFQKIKNVIQIDSKYYNIKPWNYFINIFIMNSLMILKVNNIKNRK